MQGLVHVRRAYCHLTLDPQSIGKQGPKEETELPNDVHLKLSDHDHEPHYRVQSVCTTSCLFGPCLQMLSLHVSMSCLFSPCLQVLSRLYHIPLL